ncbi:hypothetical protein LG3211_1138 [Lysobacter gummosus]|nr:hypothetical protein LG3211_1138 [Lysobacter gummosus]
MSGGMGDGHASILTRSGANARRGGEQPAEVKAKDAPIRDPDHAPRRPIGRHVQLDRTRSLRRRAPRPQTGRRTNGRSSPGSDAPAS